MNESDVVTFRYLGHLFYGAYTSRVSEWGRIIRYRDFDGTVAFIASNQVEIIL